MSSINNLFPNRGTRSETNLYEDLICESIRMYGQEFFYIPRTLVSVDKILGEDRLSEFKNAYKVVCYIDEIDQFAGGGAFLQKFGYVLEEQATLTIARREWNKSVGQYGTTILPNRPCEGDLLWYPTSDSLFEIRFVEHQPAMSFYQLGKLFVYKLKIELFQYSSERFDTGIDEVDNYALDATFDLLGQNLDTETGLPIVAEDGSEIAPDSLPEKKDQIFDKTNDLKDEARPIIDDIEQNPFADF